MPCFTAYWVSSAERTSMWMMRNSRIMMGSQISLTIGLVGVFLSLMIGTLLGVVSGYFGGWIDNVIQRVIEVLRSLPELPSMAAGSGRAKSPTGRSTTGLPTGAPTGLT